MGILSNPLQNEMTTKPDKCLLINIIAVNEVVLILINVCYYNSNVNVCINKIQFTGSMHADAL